MAIRLTSRAVDAASAAALAAYAGPVTVVPARAMSPALSASDLLRVGAPNAGAWASERSAARRQRRAARKAAVEARVVSVVVDHAGREFYRNAEGEWL